MDTNPVPVQPVPPAPMAPVQPQPIQPAPSAPVPPPPSGISFPQKKSKGFAIFVVISILILLAIWGVVGYLYYQNNFMGTSKDNESRNVSPSPEVQISPNEIQISNGNVARVTSFGETQILIKKEDYPGTGITGFAKVVVSPNLKQFCFESIAPAIQPAMYVANVDGSEPTEIGTDKNTCTWAPDSKNIFYVNAPLSGKSINIFQYDLGTKLEKNLTESTTTASEIRQYTITGISGETLKCSYDVVNASGVKLSASNCTIDTKTGEVSTTGPE